MNIHPNHTSTSTGMGSIERSGQHWALLELVRLVIRRWKPLMVVSCAAMLVMGVLMVATPNRYISTASLLPSGKTDNMSALKEAAGISNAGAVDENSSVLYPIVLQSRTIADGVLGRPYQIEHEGKQLTIELKVYFETTNPDKLRKALANATSISIEKKTGDIHLEVESKYPLLSQALAQAYLDGLEDFNINRRKSLAKENTKYLEGQILQARDSLRVAEDKLALFRRYNADWAGNTNYKILSELTRLQREAEVKSAAYLYLQQQLEMARLDVQRSVPITRVLDQPSLPTLKSRPQRTLSVLLAGITAFMITLCAVLLQEYLKREQEGPTAKAYLELRSDITRNFPRTSRVIRLVSRAKANEPESVEQR